MSPYNPEKCLRIPTDARLWITALYVAALTLVAIDIVDLDGSYLSLAGIFIAIMAQTWTCITLHAYSRRVVLEVMSWEHRQLMLAEPPRGLALID